jgi:predicted Zn finger-like uncharacterized protein
LVVICPRCKTRLKIADEKIAPQGTRFKCPKCQVVLLVKRPAGALAAPPSRAARRLPLNKNKVIIAHGKQQTAERIKDVIEGAGLQTIMLRDGIEAMVKTMTELPFLVIADVGLPKIYGFELVKRIKERPETSGIKIILVSSVYDKDRYRREPSSLYGADDYLDEHQIEELLVSKVARLSGVPATEETTPTPGNTRTPADAAGQRAPEPQPMEKSTVREEPSPAGMREQRPAAAPGDRNTPVEKARRLARTIIADINLYSPEKTENSIRQNNFSATFANELKEGKKLYDARIAPEIRAEADYFQEAIDNFINSKKKPGNSKIVEKSRFLPRFLCMFLPVDIFSGLR